MYTFVSGSHTQKASYPQGVGDWEVTVPLIRYHTITIQKYLKSTSKLKMFVLYVQVDILLLLHR